MSAPMVIYDAYGGNFTDNAQGLDPTFRTSPATRINQLIAFASGITRRIGISMPQGALAANTYCVTCRQVLPAAVETWLSNDAPKLKEQGWQLVLYTGSRMPRVGGTGAAEQNATSQTAGLEAGSIPFTTSDATWVADDCLGSAFGAVFDAIIFDAMSDTTAQLDAIDAIKDIFRSRGWFPGGVYVEPLALDTIGSPRPNNINTARFVRAPSYFTADFYAGRDNAPAPIPNAQVGTYKAGGMESHLAVDASLIRYGAERGLALLDRMKADGFTISFLGVPTADWIQKWARNAYGARPRGGRA